MNTAPVVKECRSCGARIFWCVTEAGRAMPVDAEPTLGGSVVLRMRGHQVLGRVLKRGEQPAPGETARMPHHATCPQGAEWHRRTA